LLVDVVNTIAVSVTDVNDATVVDSVRRAVQARFSHLLGNWHIRISASSAPGRWDLHLYGTFGCHVADFLAEPRQVADAVERRLHAFLCGVVPPLSPRNRPTIVRRGSAQRRRGQHELAARVGPDTTLARLERPSSSAA
jgi:hypothetical protein